MNFHCPSHLLRTVCGVFWLLLLTPMLSFAQSPLHSALDDYLRTQTQGLPGTVTYSIGQLNARAQLSECSAFEPFLPAGGRLWGKSTVGVRCLGPSNWTIYVPVSVNVTGNYLITARALPTGYLLTASDIIVRSGDLSSLPASIVTDQSQAIGKTVKNRLPAGQPLRSDQLLAPWAVQQGQSVKTVSKGPGFSVSSEGIALTNAVAGQIVQVRTASGQLINGIARPGGVVEVSH
ncbi:flagellar basal body P-ring formation chaperone FlgA [Propionivibrio sp.]|uniref:flagellar basal body P-ring formation chaperone FlgA n=1 Tax=Propionivibrio sp. TaxID=2212460 RepID=UPI003BF20464